MSTLPTAVLAGATEHDSSPLMFADAATSTTVTLGELVTDAERMAGALQARGIGPGDVVAVQLPGSREGTVAQAAVALSGATLLPIVLTYGARELSFVLRQSEASALFVLGTHSGHEHPAIALARALPALHSVVVVGDGPLHTVRFADLLGPLARPYHPPVVGADDRALLVYTSGTTAEPKGVQHSHRTLLAEVASTVVTRNTGPGFRHLAAFPPGHVAGLLGLMRVLVYGTPTVVLQSWQAARAAALVDEYGLTFGVGAPVQLAGLLAEKAAGRASLASLEEFLTGAAAVPPSLIRAADTAGITAYRCYGSSEHPTISSGWIDDPIDRRADTDGRVLPDCAVRLIDDSGDDVRPGAEGEILSRGPELFLGYTHTALDRDAFLPGGWFRSGDVGRLEDGYLTVTDRKKDIIIRGGENISSKEVEDILGEHPAVGEVAVLGFPDPMLGERVCAVVVLRSGSEPLALADVRNHFLASGAARHKTPERIVFRSELPRTPAGKIQKFLLRADVRVMTDD